VVWFSVVCVWEPLAFVQKSLSSHHSWTAETLKQTKLHFNYIIPKSKNKLLMVIQRCLENCIATLKLCVCVEINVEGVINLVLFALEFAEF